MGVFDWSTVPSRNGAIDPAIAALDGASARSYPKGQRAMMAAMRSYADDVGGALRTEGLENAYSVFTRSRIDELRDGIAILVKPHRTNTGACALNVDGHGFRPWLDRAGNSLPEGAVRNGLLTSAIYDADRGAWISDVLPGLSPLIPDAVAALVANRVPGVPLLRSMFSSVNAAVAAALAENRPLHLKPGETAELEAASGADIATKWSAIRDWRVPEGSILRIYAPGGTHAMSGPVVLHHVDGSQIELVGSQANPASRVLEWAPTYSGTAFFVGGGQRMRLVDGIELRLPYRTAENYSVGFLAERCGHLKVGPNVIARRFYWNYFARNGGSIQCDGSQGYDAGDANYIAYLGAHISCRNVIGNGADDSGNRLGSGLVVEGGGTADCNGATFSGNWLAGAHAISCGAIRGDNANVSGNTGSGWLVNGGFIDAHGSTRNNNGRYGVEWGSYEGGGFVGVPTATPTGNLLGNETPHIDHFFSGDQAGFLATGSPASISLRYDSKGSGAHFFNANSRLQFAIGSTPLAVNYLFASGGIAGSAALMSAVGSDTDVAMRFDTKNAGNFFFNANGRLQFAIGSTHLAVNYLLISGGVSGAAAMLSANGPGTDVSMRFDTKGAGNFFFNANGRAQFGIGSTALAVNYLYVAGGAAGAPVTVSAFGDDTNIDLSLVPRGSGVVRFGTWTANADAAVNGYITIRDAAGNLRKIPTIA